jgi:hypothetical protein
MAGKKKIVEESAADVELVESRDVRNGYLTGPGADQLPVQYTVIDGIALFAGCIDMGPVEEVEAEAADIRALSQADAEDAVHVEEDPIRSMDQLVELQGVGLPTNSSFLWTNGRVPFAISADLPNQARVTNAIAHLHANTGIRFIARTAAHANWVEFVPHPTVNSSAVGMRGGRQVIRLSPGATMGTAVHEMLHCIGIYHEQQRSDRNDFIDIRWQNIDPAAIGNFQTVPGSVDYYGYDYGSIMHYPRWAFSINGQDTIVPRQAGVAIGQRNGLSFTDRLTVAKLYERFFTRGYSGVWRAQSGKYGMWINATWPSFQAKWQQWSGEGMRLVDIHTRRVGSETRYSGVFLPGSGPYGLWANVSFDSFVQKRQQWASQGLRLVKMHIHRQGSENRYSGCWLPGSGGHGLWANATWDSFQAKWQEWNQQGLRLVDIHAHRVNGVNRYSGVWLAGSGGYGLWANTTWDSFVAKWKEWGNQGLRLVDLNIHVHGNQNRYSGVFRQGSGAYHLWANVTWESFRAKWEELAGQGNRLIDFDFPAPEVGVSADAFGDPMEPSVPMDPALEEDGFGGIFDGEIPEIPSEAVRPEAVEADAGLGGLILEGEKAGTQPGRDQGKGDAVIIPFTAIAESADEVAAVDVGGMGGFET